MKQVAAFQMEAVHEDLAAGFFRVFSEMGLGCQGYFNNRIFTSRGDFFDTVSHPNISMSYPTYQGRPDWDAVVEKVRAQDPRVLYFNTLQRDGIAIWGDRFNLPILAVVHNPFLFKGSDPCVDLARRGKVDMFGLAPHVVAKLVELVPELEGRAHVHHPYEWMPDDADQYTEDPEVLDIIIPGAVNFENRDFEGIINYLNSGEAEKQRPFRFAIVAGGPDRGKLEEQIRLDGLEKWFDLLPLHPETRRVPHPDYLNRLYRSHAMLPLLPQNRRDYLNSKITTGIMAALGTGRPIITTTRVGKVYGFSAIALPAGQPYAIGEADLSATTLAGRRAESLAIRKAGLEHNARTLKTVLDRVLQAA